ncbi:caspase family protein [Defluviimonas sp. WL0050]|uniref:Caspase family protein n=1 Tax=Albidovulum litorale TaxID=2984134 RepID=A0ABT2ZRV1_9RHOB|nr:caspase family protein [Defluviimonas sp. WL0050]
MATDYKPEPAASRGPLPTFATWCGSGVAAIVALASATPATAQSDQTYATLERPAEVLGMPGLSIDLTTPATRRYALVIGNGAYRHAPSLANAVADARLVAAVLKQSGYIVQEYEDLDRRGFEAALRRMITDTGKGSEIVIYYAGHGVQIGNSNRLIPVDAEIDSIYDLPFETVSLSSLLSIAGARSRSLVVILDSCRDNPFPDRGAIVGLDAIPQELRTGFAAQDSPVNSLIVFSTSPGAVALDGRGANSPFTEALYQAAIAAPDAPLDSLLKDVRRRVYSVTGGRQVPWESSSLIETVSFDSDPSVPGFQNALTTDAASVAESAGVPLALSLPLDRKVRVGTALRETATQPMDAVTVTRPPQYGRLELTSGETTRGLLPLTQMTEGVENLVYSNSQPELSALAMTAPAITDEFTVASEGKAQTVQLTLNVDPCDYQAGDHLDPEGVGVARYPNEIDVDAALTACKDAVARKPENGRFHYQLGRVHLALLDLDAAEAEFTLARDHGHTRAWHALGMLVIAREQITAGAARTRAPEEALALLAMGVDQGDPYAYHSLGQQLLELADDPTLKRQGFDLLSRSLEVGHTFSMNTLGYYFLQEGTDHYEPERGLRYVQESAARGDIYGYDNMGWVMLNGAGGVARDPKAALDWLRKASEGGHPRAPTSIGRMYFNGDLGVPDFAEAVKWYDEGLSRGDAWGGANGAWVIAQHTPEGLTLGDAAARAAKAIVLRDAEAAASARQLIDKLPLNALDMGAQVMMRELGADIVPDGAFGPASEAALATLGETFTKTFPADRKERLNELARLYWVANPFPVTVF